MIWSQIGVLLFTKSVVILNLMNDQELDLRLPAVDTLKRYSKALEYEYRVKTAALDTLKRYSILSLTLYLE
jgi:hypothetical protein